MLIDHVGIFTGVGYNIGHVFVRPWQTLTKIPPLQISEASLLENGEVREEFYVDNHYVKPASNRPLPSFRIAVDCYEGYMLILHPRDETYAKLVWVARALSKPNFITSRPHF